MSDNELSDLWQFQKSLPDSEIKILLNNALLDLVRYRRCGSVEDCENRKEWMELSIEDIRLKFNDFARQMKEYVELKTNPPKKKRGRPCKSEVKT